LFIPYGIYELREPQWNDFDRGTSDSSTRALWKFYQQSHLVAKQEEHGERNV
jgi:hypothetical protein